MIILLKENLAEIDTGIFYDRSFWEERVGAGVEREQFIPVGSVRNFGAVF